MTDQEILQLLEESDSEDDPFLAESDDDPDYINEASSSDESSGTYNCQNSSASQGNPSPSPLTPLVVQTKNSTDWSFTEPQKISFHFNKIPGLLVNVNGTEPIDYFHLLATDDFYNDLCTKANAHAVELLCQSSGDKSRIASWKDITVDELKKFFGLLFHMGTIRVNRLNDYWKKHYLFKLTAFSSFMSRNRFLLILRALQFENRQNEVTRTQIGKIKPLIDFFNDRMNVIYYPNKELSLDESMILWRGRLKFRQYIKGKRHKFGVKLYSLCEPNGLVLKLVAYSGSTDVQLGGSQHTEKVVLYLLEEKLGAGHAVYMDNFYNSVNLTETLLNNQTYVTGTLRANRKGNPPEVLARKLKKGEMVSQYNSRGICVTKWKDRREVLAISSEYNGELQEATNKRGQVKQKPQLINKYNVFMSGVDHTDQMLSYYSCEHKTLIWYKKVAIHMFQIMLLNPWFLYNGNSPSKLNYYDFRLAVIEKLLGPPPAEPIPRLKLYHLPEYCPKGENGKAKRRRCQVCWTNGKVRKDSVYYCSQCPQGPGLCLTPCFRIFHANL